MQQTSKLNQLPAVQRLASNQSAPVIESDYKPSGKVPTDESYYQVPVIINGKEYAPEDIADPYPLVPSLDEISIEKQQTSSTEDGQVVEEDPEFQVKTLEDKIRCWFGAEMPTKYDDQRPERDLINFPRLPPQLNEMPRTRLYFLPESWFKFFESKTGRSGGYVFAATVGSFIVSKELLVWNDNAHAASALIVLAIFGIKKFGRSANDYMTSSLVVSNFKC